MGGDVHDQASLGRPGGGLCRQHSADFAAAVGFIKNTRRTEILSGVVFYPSMWRPKKPDMVWSSLYSVSPLCSWSPSPAKRTQPSTSPSARMGAAQTTPYLPASSEMGMGLSPVWCW